MDRIHAPSWTHNRAGRHDLRRSCAKWIRDGVLEQSPLPSCSGDATASHPAFELLGLRRQQKWMQRPPIPGCVLIDELPNRRQPRHESAKPPSPRKLRALP